MSAGVLRVFGCALLAGLLAACGAASQNQKPRFNLSGYSEMFKKGHADGCASADGAQRRDAGLYRKDADYMMGWNDGNSACKR